MYTVMVVLRSSETTRSKSETTLSKSVVRLSFGFLFLLEILGETALLRVGSDVSHWMLMLTVSPRVSQPNVAGRCRKSLRPEGGRRKGEVEISSKKPKLWHPTLMVTPPNCIKLLKLDFTRDLHPTSPLQHHSSTHAHRSRLRSVRKPVS